MIAKSILAICLYLTPFAIILFAGITNLWILFPLWAIMGLGKSFIGTSVMHDALHGAYSQKKSLNALMGFSTWLLGIDAKIWQVQHNVLHHTYTNIEHADDDIAPRYVLRFTPHQERYWFHRFQHLYVIFFYAISIFTWILFRDFVKVVEYKNKRLLKTGADFYRHLAIIVMRKIVYFSIFLVLPMIVLPFSPGIVFLMFLTMHAVTGIALSLIFQPAHIIESSVFLEQEEEQIEENWWIHQVMTTANFSERSRFFSWFIGGLNYQIEHHLFPDVCHVHYPKIASIVQRTAQEFGIPYRTQGNFLKAVANHFAILRQLGRQNSLDMEKVPVYTTNAPNMKG